MLLRAGDVESNPEPACGVCSTTIGDKPVAFECVECHGLTHVKCTELKKREVDSMEKGDRKWTCRICQGEVRDLLDETEGRARAAVEGVKYGECRKKLRKARVVL